MRIRRIDVGFYLYETSVEEKGGGYYLPGQTWGIANVLSIKEVVYPAMLKKVLLSIHLITTLPKEEEIVLT